LILSALIYHSVAGIKHLVMDLGFGETLQSTKIGSIIVIVVSAVLIVLTGAWLWL